jgi:hypothetical protein
MEVAKEFCRTCLGWENASWHLRQNEMYIFDRKRNLLNMFWVKDFNFWNLGAVEYRVAEWCDSHACIAETSYFKGEYMARVFLADTQREYVAWQHASNAEAALMHACIDSARAIR